jgi:hypothetical protein
VWALFGDFQIDTLEAGRSLLPSLFLIALLIIAQVLLLNLLIAMMTDTYTAVNSRALVEWKYEHMLLVDYYVNSASAIPPPLNLLLGPPRWAAALWRHLHSTPHKGRLDTNRRASDPACNGAGLVPLGTEHRDETRAYHSYLHWREQRERALVGARVNDVSRVVTSLELKQMEDREALDTHMDTLGKDIGWLKQQVSHVPRASNTTGRGKEHGAARKLQRRRLHWRARSQIHTEYKDQRTHVPDWRTPW